MTLDETSDLANIRLRLRGGLEFEIRESGRQPCCVINDTVAGDYYQVGLAEYALISLIDGKTRLHEAVSETAGRLGDDAMDQHEALAVFHWLVCTGLAEPVDDDQQSIGVVARLRARDRRKSSRESVGRLNLLFIRLPLGDPAPLLGRITPTLRWITSPFFFCVWLAVCVIAMTCVFLRREILGDATLSVVESGGWFWMLVSFVMLKVVHELAHGVFCHQRGGRVKQAGIVFILFVPIPYLDVTSCWGFPSKWQRISVSAAGMYVEWFIAAIAAIAWFFATDPTTQFHLFTVMLAGCISTLLFNANFLMRFDGYYILADLVDIPNLYARGQRFLTYLGKRHVLGIQIDADRESHRDTLIIAVYGFAAFFWRIVVCVTLAIAASSLLYGFGLALAVIGATIWLAMPLFSFIRFLSADGVMQRPQWNRLCLTSALSVGLLVMVCTWIPWPQRISAPAVVRFFEPANVRAETAGFVHSIHVRDAELVEAGSIIVTLRNDQLAARHQTLLCDRDESIVRSRRYHTAREIAPYQSEVAARQAIETELAETQRQIDSLIIRAPRSGTVNAPQIGSRLGSYVARGETLVEIVDHSRKEILIAIDQHDFEPFDTSDQGAVSFHARGPAPPIRGMLRRVDPTASTQIDPRLTAAAGGPLALRVQPPAADQSSTSAMQLVHARFQGWVDVPPATSDQLRTGTTGHVYLDQYSHSIGSHLRRLASDWLATQSARTSMR